MALNDYLAMQNWSQPVADLMGTSRPVPSLLPQFNLGNTMPAVAAPAGFTPPMDQWGSDWSTGLPSAMTATPANLQGDWLGNLGNWFKGAVGTKEAPGWGGLALGAMQGLGSGYLGMKQYGIAKKTLEEGKRQFNMNWDAQKTTTNAALEDRQRARVASNGGAYQSVGDYMNQNGVR